MVDNVWSRIQAVVVPSPDSFRLFVFCEKDLRKTNILIPVSLQPDVVYTCKNWLIYQYDIVLDQVFKTKWKENSSLRQFLAA